jgi:hypothetical protein
MKHTRTFVLVVSALLTSVSGNSSFAFQRGDRITPNPDAERSKPFVVNVQEFGAKSDGKSDCTPAFQAAVDNLAARLKKLPPKSGAIGTVIIPAAPGVYRLGGPVWVDHECIEIRGEGHGTRVETLFGHNHPLFIFGLRRVATITVDSKPVTLVADARYRTDIFGRLDETAASAPGQRWGFRTRGETLLQAQASPLSDGAFHSRGHFTADHWTETRKLTLETAFEFSGTTLPKDLPIFGIGSKNNNRPFPFVVHTGNEGNDLQVQFATQSEPFGPIAIRRFGFELPAQKGPRRVAIQIDLDNARVTAFVDGRQVKTTGVVGPEFTKGLRFAENDFYPLLVANDGGDRPSLGTNNHVDWVLYGLLFSRSLRYIDDGPGNVQKRVDGRAINDLFRYFTPPADDPHQIGHFPFTDNPKTSGRSLLIQGGPAAENHQAWAIIHHSLAVNEGGVLNNAIRDIYLVGGHAYGQNICIGQVLEFNIKGVKSMSAYHAIGSLNHSANYVIRLEDSHLSGTDSGYHGFNQLVWARNLTFENAGRATMRFAGCNARVENAMVSFFAAGNQSTIKIHSGDYGGNYTFENLTVDYEGDVYEHTPIYCESHPYAPATSLRLRDIFLGSVGHKLPLITLRTVPPHNASAFLSVDNLQSFTKKVGAVVDVDSPVWRGKLRGVAVGGGEGVRYRGKPGTQTRIHIDD